MASDDVQNEYTSLSDEQIASLNNQLLQESSSSTSFGHGNDQQGNSENNNKILIGEKESIDLLADEYKNGSKVYQAKVEWLRNNGYVSWRRIAGDGDCFFRALVFVVLESFIQDPNCVILSHKLRQRILDQWGLLEKAGYSPNILEEFWDPLKELINETSKEPSSSTTTNVTEKTITTFAKSMNDPEISNYVVVFLRLLTSAFLRENMDEYLPFLFSYEDDVRLLDEDGMPSMKKFCEFYVEPVNKEADHIVISALSKALSIDLQIAYFDQSNQPAPQQQQQQQENVAVNFYHFSPSNDDSNDWKTTKGDSVKCPLVTLLYRPGHYDTLYHTTPQ